MFKITDVRIYPLTNQKSLLAFADVVFDDCFVVRDVKVIHGRDGLFINMPSRKINDRCHRCNKPNPLPARYCSWCGMLLNANRDRRDERGRLRNHVDICHPVSADCRYMIQQRVLDAYEREMQSGTNADRVSAYDMDPEDYESRCVYE